MKTPSEKLKRDIENIRNHGIKGIQMSIEEDYDFLVDFMREPRVDKLLPEKYRNVPKGNRRIKAGDVIAVSRMGVYQHFAVYIGKGYVVHFAAPGGDWGGEPMIHKAPFENFLRESKEFVILDFPATPGEPEIFKGVFPSASPISVSTVATDPSLNIDIGLAQRIKEEYHLYSPEETVKRAKAVAKQRLQRGNRFEAMIDGHKYNLVINNCEHFAIWCKTGVHESRQVEAVLSMVKELFVLNNIPI